MSQPHPQGHLMIRVSTDPEDPQWDEFLTRVPLGQFQQSSRWAQAKRGEGWEPIRVQLLFGGEIRGGFQVLSRRHRFLGRIGYISKGPVLFQESQEAAGIAVQQLLGNIQDRRLRALIVQAPDASVLLPEVLVRHGFLPNHLMQVIGANLVIDLRGGMKQVEEGMRPHTRQEVRQALRRGVRIREGGEEDLPTFFRLMVATCQRQRTMPNPGSEKALQEMWRALQAGGHVRLSLAECGGETVAGLFSIPFGRRVTFWKKGWSGGHRDSHPNQLLFWEAIEWAQARGYESCDFAALGVRLARSILADEPISEEMKRTRDFFNMGFGGRPVLLPEALVSFPHPILRVVYQRFASREMPPIFRRLRDSLLP